MKRRRSARTADSGARRKLSLSRGRSGAAHPPADRRRPHPAADAPPTWSTIKRDLPPSRVQTSRAVRKAQSASSLPTQTGAARALRCITTMGCGHHARPRSSPARGRYYSRAAAAVSRQPAPVIAAAWLAVSAISAAPRASAFAAGPSAARRLATGRRAAWERAPRRPLHGAWRRSRSRRAPRGRYFCTLKLVRRAPASGVSQQTDGPTDRPTDRPTD